MEASRLHGQLRERLHASQDQKGGAYIFRPEGGAQPVRDAAGGKQEGGVDDGQDELVIREWWVEEGPIVSEVYQVNKVVAVWSTSNRFGGLLWASHEGQGALGCII